MKATTKKQALIVKFGQIGDVIMAIPAVRALYEQGFDIHWVCGRAAQPLLECYSWITVIPIDDRAILCGGIWERTKNIANLWRRVAFKGYDICATLYYDRRFHLLTLPICARRKLALSGRSRATSLLAGRHHTDEYSRVLLGIADGCRELSSQPVRPDRIPLFGQKGEKASRRVAIVPGGTSNVLGQQVLRRWPVENYVVLAHEMVSRGWEVVLLGGAEDVWVRSYFQQLAVTDAIGTMSLPQVIQACNACDAVISHDTGPLHLAGLSDTCLVGIFGPTDPATRVPRRPFAVGIWGGQGFACRPCYDGRDFASCQFNGCMHQVTPHRVLRELDQLLSDRSLGVSSPWRVVYPDVDPLAGDKTLTVLR
ncbi:MAG: glycosyltransferase family 9 protein [Edaphobacter sp.]